jgi:putative copper export protein
MIQRIQSVFLLLLALAMLSVLALPLWHKADPLSGQELTLTALGLAFTDAKNPHPAGASWLIAVLAGASALVAAFEIFQFRNRMLQLKLGALNVLLIAGTIGAAFYYSNQGEQLLNPTREGSFDAGFYLPTLALILNLLANRFIRRDDQLVRSMDRLR